MNPLLIRRRGMMAKEAVLPDGQLEWVETDGNSYIDSGVLAHQPLSAITKLLCVPSSENQFWLGYQTDNTHRFAFFVQYPSTLGLGYRNGSIGGNYAGIDITQSLNDSTPIEAKNSNGVGTNVIKISVKQQGDIDYTNLTYDSNNSISYNSNVYLLCVNQAGVPTFHVHQGGRLYFMQLFSDSSYSNIIRDYIPWRLNGVAGLWDNVSQTFFAPQGGTLTGGPNVI